MSTYQGSGQLALVLSRIQALEAALAWKALPYEKAWEDSGIAGNAKGQYALDPFKMVHIRGLIKSHEAYAFPATNLVIAKLPEAFWPALAQPTGVAWQKDSAGNFSLMPLVVTTVGGIQLTYGNSDSLGATNGNAVYLALIIAPFSTN